MCSYAVLFLTHQYLLLNIITISVHLTVRGKLSHVSLSHPICSQTHEQNCTFAHTCLCRVLYTSIILLTLLYTNSFTAHLQVYNLTLQNTFQSYITNKLGIVLLTVLAEVKHLRRSLALNIYIYIYGILKDHVFPLPVYIFPVAINV